MYTDKFYFPINITHTAEQCTVIAVSAIIRIDWKDSVMFEILTGFRQGCILSPILFNVGLDCILRQRLDSKLT